MKMRKTISAMLAAAMLATLGASCAGDNGAPDTAYDTSQKINVISREDGSGTRGAFIELFGVEQKDADGKKIDHTTERASITNNTAVMMTSVAGDKYAIGYISLGSMNDSVKALDIDGVKASAENIKNGTYKIARPFNIVTKPEISPLAADFISYIMSDDGQAVINDNGYISVAAGKTYNAEKPEGKLVIAGSSSVTPVMEKLKEAYMKLNTNVKIEIQQNDSTTGISSAKEGVCDIGMASRELKDSELEGGVSGTVIAMDGIAVIVNKNSPLEELTSEAVMKIYTGESGAWADLIK